MYSESPIRFKFQQYKPYTLGADNNPIFPHPLPQKKNYADAYAHITIPDEQKQFEDYLANLSVRKHLDDAVQSRQHLIQKDEQTLLLTEMRDSLKDFNQRQRDEMLLAAGITDPTVKEELERNRQRQISEELTKRGLPYDITSRTNMKAAILRSLPAPSIPVPAHMTAPEHSTLIDPDSAVLMDAAMGGAEERKDDMPAVTDYAAEMARLNAELSEKLGGFAAYKKAMIGAGSGDIREQAAKEYLKTREAEIEYYTRERNDVIKIRDEAPPIEREGIQMIIDKYESLIKKNEKEKESAKQALNRLASPKRGKK
jgi:hypothetical protein